MLSIRTINYAAPPAGSFWTWSADHDAIEWHDGTTLALWQELHTVVKHLGEAGWLPPLGSMLLLLAACRDEWLKQAIEFHPKVMSILAVTKTEDIPLEIRTTLVGGLKVVHDLPKDLRSSLTAKCHLVAALFEGGPHSLLRSESNTVLRELSVPGPRALAGCVPAMDAKARLLRDLRALRIGLARHDAASLESFLRTGLDDSSLRPVVLAENTVAANEPGILLDRLLAAGGETGAAAAVAKRAIAMMNFPGHFGTPRDLPVGGIADITNRGTVDRLLPGELAWDDLVLAARLVHNEALYFRREIPPMDVALRHTVLLDRGLRLWGTGRVFALGVALGLRHHPAWKDRDETCECAAANGTGFVVVDLGTPQGIRSALETLVPAPSPMIFLTAWWETALLEDDRAIPDLSFITAKEHLEDAATRNLLGEIAEWIHGRSGNCRVLALSRNGELEAQAWSPAGIRLLFRGELDLDAILADARATSQHAAPPPLRVKPDPLRALLPIYALDRLPFLFPLAPQASAFLPDEAAAASNGGGMGVTVNRRLLHWPQPGWGGQELAAAVPGRQHWLGRDEHGGVIVIASGEKAGDGVRVFRWEAGRLLDFEGAKSMHPFPSHAAVSGGAMILAYSNHIEAFSLATGLRLVQQKYKKPAILPTLHYDGESISVFEAEKNRPSKTKLWQVVGKTWPHLLVPDGVAWFGHLLCLRCGKLAYAFHHQELQWRIIDAIDIPFIAFERSDFIPGVGVTLKLARTGHNIEIWHDSRGFLSLRVTAKNRPHHLTILLASEATSVWHQERNLLSLEPRLRAPGSQAPDTDDLGFLTVFFHGAFNQQSTQ